MVFAATLMGTGQILRVEICTQTYVLRNLHRKSAIPLNACATWMGSDGDEMLAVHQEFNFFIIADMDDTFPILALERKRVKEF